MVKIKDLSKVGRPRANHHGTGHWKRLRQRFLKNSFNGFLDYEIVELLLTLGGAKIDYKQQAKQAIKKFKGLRNVLDAPPEDLQRIKGIGPSSILGLKLFQAISEQYAKEKIPKKISLTSPQVVADYLREKIGKEKKEYFIILSLDSRNYLIRENIVSIGTLNANLVHPREVFKEAIDARAALVIIAHNHPSGDTEPSEDDLTITKRLIEAGKIIGIDVLDHIIITKTKIFSFKERGLI